jgi:hypothetical protein
MLGCAMPSKDKPEAKQSTGPSPAAEHVAGAHRLMKSLEDRIGEHPELSEAIREVELALSILTVKTAGFL